MNLIYFLLIGLAAGWLAGQFMKGKGFGLLGNLVIGAIGAILGGHLLGLINFHGYGLVADLVTAFIGAVVLIWLIRLVKKV